MSFQGSSNRLAVKSRDMLRAMPGSLPPPDWARKATGGVRKASKRCFEEAGSVPVAAQTAWHGIFTHGHLEKGQTILIHGGAGAVGAYAVQLASHADAIVIATASGDDEA